MNRFIGYSDNMERPTCITPWSYIHLLSGLNFSLLSLSYLSKHSVIKNLIIFIIIHTIYECKDLYITYIISNNKKYYQNTLINSIGDTIFSIFGWILGYIIYLSKPNTYYVISFVILQLISVALFILNRYG